MSKTKKENTETELHKLTAVVFLAAIICLIGWNYKLQVDANRHTEYVKKHARLINLVAQQVADGMVGKCYSKKTPKDNTDHTFYVPFRELPHINRYDFKFNRVERVCIEKTCKLKFSYNHYLTNSSENLIAQARQLGKEVKCPY